MISSAHRIRVATLLATAAAIGTLAPAASANHALNVPRPHEGIYVNPSTGFASIVATASRPQSKIYVNPSTGFATPASAPSSEPAPATLTQPSPAGFDWPSAGIGAAAIGGLMLLLLAAMIGVGRHGRGPLTPRGPLRG